MGIGDKKSSSEKRRNHRMKKRRVSEQRQTLENRNCSPGPEVIRKHLTADVFGLMAEEIKDNDRKYRATRLPNSTGCL